jgi:hypothetical protein
VRLSNELRISCRRSCRRPQKPTLRLVLEGRGARAELGTRPACRLHARVRRCGVLKLVKARSAEIPLGRTQRLTVLNHTDRPSIDPATTKAVFRDFEDAETCARVSPPR